MIKGIGKIFHAVGKVVKGVFHAVKKAVVDLWHIPIIRYVIIAVAAYFTAGAALAYFGGAAAAGGTAGAFAAGSTAEGVLSGTAAYVGGTGALAATTAGAGLTADLAATAATGAIAAGTAASAGTGLAADLAGTAAGEGFGAATSGLATAATDTPSLAAFSGQAAGHAAALSGLPASAQASATAATSTGNFGQATVQQAAQNASADLSQSGTGALDQGSAFGQQTSSDVSSFYSNGTSAMPATSDTAASGSNGLLSPNTTFSGPGAITPTGAAPETAGGPAVDSGNIVTRALRGVGNLAKDAWNTFDKAKLDTKLSLLSTALQVGSAMLAKQQPQMQFAGVNSKGYGPGTLIHTTNNGFGLGVGGGQQAPTGVPSSLLPPGSAPTAPQLATTSNPGAGPTLPGLTSAPSTIKGPPAAPGLAG